MIHRGLWGQLSSFVPVAIALASITAAFHLSGVRINASASLPIGLYRTTSDVTAKLVEFCPAEPLASLSAIRGYRGKGSCPDGAEPLMKPVVALPGDTVEVSAQGVAVNGKLLPNSAPQQFDTKNRTLAHCPFGKYHVSEGSVWVISSYNPRSFDSRYFGAIRLSSIRSRLRPLITELP